MKDLLEKMFKRNEGNMKKDLEGATHVATSDNSRGTWFSFVKAFTLAEVLITLGIIGVVAAMTIPTLVKNYQKQVLVTQLKKSVTTLENGFKKMMADDEVDNFFDTTLYQQLGDNHCLSVGYTSLEANDSCKLFIDGLKNYFNIIDIGKVSSNYKWNFRDGSNFDDKSQDDFIKLADGTSFFINFIHNYGNYISIDINGSKGPNAYGRDVFDFVILGNGHIEDSNFNNCNNASASGCYNKILQNGWKMNY